MYQTFASSYDALYKGKDYRREAGFLHGLLVDARTVLDVGCGTGTHMRELEALGYSCAGLDLNEEMLAVAGEKVQGRVFQGDMRSFDLGQRFDAITCLFAAFNHNLTDHDVTSTLERMHTHLNPGGLLIVDLFNPRGGGRKVDEANGVTRVMEWQWEEGDPIVHSKVVMTRGDEEEVHDLPFRFFPLQTLESLFEGAGFCDVTLLGDYFDQPATPASHNVIVTGRAY